jgi:hypothetical protein
MLPTKFHFIWLEGFRGLYIICLILNIVIGISRRCINVGKVSNKQIFVGGSGGYES